jgi:hypothetical protein
VFYAKTSTLEANNFPEHQNSCSYERTYFQNVPNECEPNKAGENPIHNKMHDVYRNNHVNISTYFVTNCASTSALPKKTIYVI